ncbi:MAG: glucose-6-phosphate isomerase, partial [Paracoccus sp. (in: a-proteobacteria)]|nr:glucose-6-phosphate isomerase [Paracoccus sp. (in: a-proteobacteria)]
MTDIWTRLRALHAERADTRIEALFAGDPDRAERRSISAEGLVFDYSKTLLDDELVATLLDLARASRIEARREAMFTGARINETEDRAVLHTALRNLEGSVSVDGQDVMPAVRETHARMSAFARDLRAGRIKGQGGTITDVVNIGIGGSDLGPAMAVLALAPYHDGPGTHFVSNVDGADIADTLAGLDATRTLIIVASKTFTTIETMTNARTARDWMA